MLPPVINKNAPKEATINPITLFLVNFSLKIASESNVIRIGLIRQSTSTGNEGPIKEIAE